MAGIPDEFNEDFLAWFRERTEAAWDALPARTPEEVLADYVEAGVGGCEWQRGTRWLGGLSDEEIEGTERRRKLTFPPDYRLFLHLLHTVDRPMFCASYLGYGEQPDAASAQLAAAYVEPDHDLIVLEDGPSFYNWLTDAEALEAQSAWLWEGLQFDVEYNDLWPKSWGPKPETLDEQKRRARELVEAAPRLIPIFVHRYLLAEPCAARNPVLSVYQSDIVVYGNDLREYLLAEFGDILGLDRRQRKQVEKARDAGITVRLEMLASIPFWGELMFGESRDGNIIVRPPSLP
jgi:hypothetical protein